MSVVAEDQIECAENDLRSDRLQWAIERWQPLLVVALAAPIVIAALFSGLYWPGRIFPGFFVLENRIVPTVSLYGWTGTTHDVPSLAQVLTVDGRSVATAADIDAIVSTKEGQTVRYELRAGANTIERIVPTMRFGSVDYWLTFGLFIVNGIITIAAGVAVALMQPRTSEARAFLAFSAVFGTVMLSAPPMYNPQWCWLTPVNLAALAFWGAGFVHLSFVFPVARPRFAAWGWMLAPYVLSTALTAWILVGFYATVPDLSGTVASWIYTAAGMIVLVGSCADAYRTDPRPMTRARVRVILPALVFSCSLAFFGQIENAVSGRFPINLSVLLPVFFYLAIGYSIVRHDLFDIDRLVRQAAIYTVLTLSLTGAYALVLVVFSSSPVLQAATGSSAVHIVAIVFAALVFERLKQRVQRIVDRLFFRTRVQYRRTVHDVSASLATLTDVEAILGVVGQRLETDLAPTSIHAALWFGDEETLWSVEGGIATRSCATEDLKAMLSPARSHPVSRASVERAPANREKLRDWMATKGVELVVPFNVQARMVGALLLGSRKSGLPYGTSERDLLETLAIQMAAALQNAALDASNAELSRAYRTLQDTQAQLLQSEKMASLGQLVAGVAHEINTPVTSVVGNVGPLLRELKRLRERVAATADAPLEGALKRMEAITEVMSRGAERTAAIVQDLRVFSRVEEARPLPMDLHEGIDVCLRLLHPRWADRVEIHRDYGSVPPVDAVAGQINQVFMNLLANACDAIDGRGNIWIATRADGERVVATIRDDGCGMPADVQAKAFDPFFTTKPVGKGMGLGLAICTGIVAGHGGAIAVASEPDAGTTFTVVLPLRKAE